MATPTKTAPRLKTRYVSELREQLRTQLELTNVMQVPNLTKVVINMGVGAATQQASLLDGAVADLTLIAGQKPAITRAKKSIATFKLREGNPIGAKVTLRVAADYAGVIEGQKAGQIHIGYYGPASYARAWMVSGGNVQPFVQETRGDGSRGYYAVVYVKKDAPIKSLEDLKGKKIGLVDPNSMSGTMAPTYFMEKEGKPISTYFGASIMTGSHENAVLAVGNGQVDAAFNWWNSEGDSNLSRMAKKGVVKAEDFRVVWKSPLLPSSLHAYLNDMPADLKTAIQKAYLEMHTKDKAAFDKMSDGKDGPYAVATHKDYEETVALNKFVDELRKKKTN